MDDWKDLLTLLKGSVSSGKLAAQALLNAITSDDLPNLFHEICTDTLISSDWSTRSNAGFAIHLLTQRYTYDLHSLISSSSCDGDLLLLSDLDLHRIISLGPSAELRNTSSNSCNDDTIGLRTSLYDKKWIAKQRIALLKKIGYETEIDDVAVAMKYSSAAHSAYSSTGSISRKSNKVIDDNIIEDEDFSIDTTTVDMELDVSVHSDNSVDIEENNLSAETWFTRLVRYMIVGLMNSKWETRHGCSVGLTSVINGLFPSSSISSSVSLSSIMLPSFLVEDIICSSLCVLTLDRFLDFGVSLSAISPVKEAAGQLVACAMRYCAYNINSNDISSVSSPMGTVVVGKLFEMIEYNQGDWFLSHGGLIAMKYSLPLNHALFLPHYLDRIVNIVLHNLRLHNDDLVSISFQMVKSLHYGLLRCDATAVELSPATIVRHATVLLNTMMNNINMLHVLSGTVCDICHAIADIIAILNTFCIVDAASVKLCVILTEVVSCLLMKLDLFTESIKADAISMLLASLQKINESLLSQAIAIPNIQCNPIAVATAASSLLTSFLCSMSTPPAKSLGDLHLVTKETQDAPHAASFIPSDSALHRKRFLWEKQFQGFGRTVALSLLHMLHLAGLSVGSADGSSSHSGTFSSASMELIAVLIDHIVAWKYDDTTGDTTGSSSNTVSLGKCKQPHSTIGITRCNSNSGSDKSVVTLASVHKAMMDRSSSMMINAYEGYCTVEGHRTVDVDEANKRLLSLLGIFVSTDDNSRMRVARVMADVVIEALAQCDSVSTSMYLEQYILTFEEKLVTSIVAVKAMIVEQDYSDRAATATANATANATADANATATVTKKMKFIYTADNETAAADGSRQIYKMLSKYQPLVDYSEMLLMVLSLLCCHNQSPTVGQQLLVKVIVHVKAIVPLICKASNIDNLLLLLRLLHYCIESNIAHMLETIESMSMSSHAHQQFAATAAVEVFKCIRGTTGSTGISSSCNTRQQQQLCIVQTIVSLLSSDSVGAKAFVVLLTYSLDRRVFDDFVSLDRLLSCTWNTTSTAATTANATATTANATAAIDVEQSMVITASTMASLQLLACIVTSLSEESCHWLVEVYSVCSRIIQAVAHSDEIVADSDDDSGSNGMHLITRVTDVATDIIIALYNSHSTTTAADSNNSNRFKRMLITQCATAISEVLVNVSIKSYKERLVAACMLSKLASKLQEGMLPCFVSFIQSAVSVITDYHRTIRRTSMDVLRTLVPYAPLAYNDYKKTVAVAAAVAISSSAATIAVTKNSDIVTEAVASDVSAFTLTDSEDILIMFSGKNVVKINENRVYETVISYISSRTKLFCTSDSAAAGTIGNKPAIEVHTFAHRLRDYQVDGVSWLQQLRVHGMGAILADEMGIGKTIQALAALCVARVQKKLSNVKCYPSLIVCPATLCMHWVKEIEARFPPDLLHSYMHRIRSTSCVAASSLIGDSYYSSIDDTAVVVVSYETFRRDHKHFCGSSIVWETVILDEAHIIKNSLSQAAVHAYALKAVMRIALTGTPIQNHVEEVWSLMNFVMPDFLGTYDVFNREYIRPIQKSFKEKRYVFNSATAIAATSASQKLMKKYKASIDISTAGIDLLNKLHKQMLPFILRRTKSMVASELPSKTIVDVMCPLSPLQRQLYAKFQTGLSISDDLLASELATLKANESLCRDISNSSDVGVYGNAERKIHPMKALMYLKLLSVHPSLVIANSHQAYKKRILSEGNTSGKMLSLSRLLVECGVMHKSECCAWDKLFIDEAGTTTVTVVDAHDGDDGDGDDDGGGGDGGGDGDGDGDGDVGATCMNDFFASVRPLKRKTTDEETEDEIAVEREDKPESTDSGHEPAPVPSPQVKVHGKSSITNVRRKILNAQQTVGTRQSQRLLSRGASSAMMQGPTDPSGAIAPCITGRQRNRSTCKDSSSTDDSSAFKVTHKCLIFAQHKAALDIIEVCVLRRFFPTVKYARLDGDVSPERRATVAREFDDKRCYASCTVDDIRILLMTTRACGLGLNLTAADTVIFIEHDWNPFIDLQAMDRVHRIGQTEPVTVYRLLAESTIEARVLGLQDLKHHIVDELINDANAGNSDDNGNSSSSSGVGFGTTLWKSIKTSVVDSTNISSGAVGLTLDDDYELMNLDHFLKSVGID